MKQSELKAFLDEKVEQYNNPVFIETDPISIPHRFTGKADIEISGFLTATIAWGNRKSILKSGEEMMRRMDNRPYQFVMQHSQSDLDAMDGFVHRTFNAEDLKYFVQALQYIYSKKGGMEQLFAYPNNISLQQAIHNFRTEFFSLPHSIRTEKHLSDPLKGSAAKRINMFLRWMVRNDRSGVDFGIWETISPSRLSCPLDVHSGRVARSLKLLSRKQNDAKAVVELDSSLRKLDSTDPVKYDYALFGLGVFEGF